MLVMAGESTQPSVKTWTDGYQEFYRLLSKALFPSFERVTAFYVDQGQPLIVAVYGEATPVIIALAGFVAPYVVARQGTRPLEVEVVGMMDMILEELEATDLPRDEYRHLRDNGAATLRQLLDSAVRQLPLTPAARPMFEDRRRSAPALQTQTVVTARVAPPPRPPICRSRPPRRTRCRRRVSAATPDLPETPKRTFDPQRCADLLQPRHERAARQHAARAAAARRGNRVNRQAPPVIFVGAQRAAPLHLSCPYVFIRWGRSRSN
ncbi:MAG: hypothetical protein U0521_20850 [Anaerolineae bacterium]